MASTTSSSGRKPRIAVVSPFLDRSHGTERIALEWIECLTGNFEVHVYSQEVRDTDTSKFVWHRIPKLPGPHLLNYSWWYFANRIVRNFDRAFRGIRYDLVFSAGINCSDADVISVHIVFAEYARTNAESLRLAGAPLPEWPTRIHRRLYYWLISYLEGALYTNPSVTLIPVAQRTARQLTAYYGAAENMPIVYAGIDLERFSPAKCTALRLRARHELGLRDDSFALLLIGNDWRNKGVPVLLEAAARLGNLPLQLIVVTRKDHASVRATAEEMKVNDRVHLFPFRSDVEFYFAAADVYVGPSLEDSFSMPVAEAMACGLPVITSAAAGVSEIISNGVDGLILDNPSDASALASMIRALYEDATLRSKLGDNAAATAQHYSWDRSGAEIVAILEQVFQRKARATTEPAEVHD
jgi:glycosyltransferase involved in cell wall biosynthesis